MFKVSKNSKAGGNVDLTLTGALGKGLTIRRKGQDYEIFSTDSKFEHIALKYGVEQFNLSEEQQKQLFDELYLKVLEQYITNVWLV